MIPDVLIIGGGVIGLSIARELSARGVGQITVVDRGELGGEASWAAAGMLAPNIEAGGSDVFHRFCTESLELYPGLANSLLAETGIDIELDRSGTVCVAFDDSEADALGQHQSPAQQLSGDEIRELEPWVSDAVVGGMLFPHDWQVENRKLISALRSSAEANDVRILEHTEVSQMLVDLGRVTGVMTSRGELLGGTTVVATGAWTSLIKTGESAMPFSVKPILGQMASFHSGERRMQRVVFSARGYLVPRMDGRISIGATVEDVGFEKRTTPDAIEELRNAAVQMAPALAGFPIADQWSGLRPFVADALPVISKLPRYENVIVATAHYRNGILLAPRTAEIVADKIVGDVDSQFFVPFGAGRFVSPATNAAVKN